MLGESYMQINAATVGNIILSGDVRLFGATTREKLPHSDGPEALGISVSPDFACRARRGFGQSITKMFPGINLIVMNFMSDQ
jgi:hypothetical protein